MPAPRTSYRSKAGAQRNRGTMWDCNRTCFVSSSDNGFRRQPGEGLASNTKHEGLREGWLGSRVNQERRPTSLKRSTFGRSPGPAHRSGKDRTSYARMQSLALSLVWSTNANTGWGMATRREKEEEETGEIDSGDGLLSIERARADCESELMSLSRFVLLCEGHGP